MHPLARYRRSADSPLSFAWRAVVFLALALTVWLALTAAASGVFRDGAVVRLVALILGGALCYFLIAGVVDALASGARRFDRRVLVWFLRAVVAVPLCFSLAYAAYDVIVSVPVRADGELPVLVALIGRGEHDVTRVLGRERRLREQRYDPSEIEAVSIPWGSETVRNVTYALPDLDAQALASSKSAVGPLSAFWNRIVAIVRPAPPSALVTVYYSDDGLAVGARMQLSRLAVAESLGGDWSRLLPRACGLDGDQVAVPAPRWAPSAPTTGTADQADKWAVGRSGDKWVGYSIRTTASAVTQAAGGQAGGGGDVAIAVGISLRVGLPVAAGMDQRQIADASDTPGGVTPTGDTFYDRSFNAIVCETFTSEKAARERAKSLDTQARSSQSSQEASPAIVVERSGHLQGLAEDDCWVLLSSTGYESVKTAKVKAVGLAWRLGVAAKVVTVTKRCGDVSIRRIEVDQGQ